MGHVDRFRVHAQVGKNRRAQNGVLTHELHFLAVRGEPLLAVQNVLGNPALPDIVHESGDQREAIDFRRWFAAGAAHNLRVGFLENHRHIHAMRVGLIAPFQAGHRLHGRGSPLIEDFLHRYHRTLRRIFAGAALIHHFLDFVR